MLAVSHGKRLPIRREREASNETGQRAKPDRGFRQLMGAGIHEEHGARVGPIADGEQAPVRTEADRCHWPPWRQVKWPAGLTPRLSGVKANGAIVATHSERAAVWTQRELVVEPPDRIVEQLDVRGRRTAQQNRLDVPL